MCYQKSKQISEYINITFEFGSVKFNSRSQLKINKIF